MSASTHAVAEARTGFQALGPTNGGNAVWKISTYSVTAALSANDVLQMIKIPSGATIIDGYSRFIGAPAFAWTVGDGDNAARFSAAKTASASAATGTTSPFSRSPLPYTYSSDDTIDIKTTVVTGTTNAKFTLAVCYVVDGQ